MLAAILVRCVSTLNVSLHYKTQGVFLIRFQETCNQPKKAGV
jgi:hypothetical protein